MAEKPFEQRKRITTAELQEGVPASVQHVQQEMAKEVPQPRADFQIPRQLDPNNAPFQIGGNIPPELKQMIQGRAMGNAESQPPSLMAKSKPRPAENDEEYETFEAPPERVMPKSKPKSQSAPAKTSSSDAFEKTMTDLLSLHQWEEFEFPSKGKFYNNIPSVIHVRPMTGEEEQILSTPRYVKKGKAIDMIFEKCIKEQFPTDELLSSDRTHLLIYLRGISYTPQYDVEIKCPNCSTKFSHVINLDQIDVTTCPEDFGPESMSGVLPVSKLPYSYRMATGKDEQEIQLYRDKRIQQWGDQTEDDSLLYRTALLLNDINGVTRKKELAMLLKKLPIMDVAHLRNEINTPPFGVDMSIPMICPNSSCSEEFKIDLPLETSFFFPRKKTDETQA